jgi:hypothetical protein
MNDNVRSALAQARLYTDGELYCLIHLPACAITPAAAVLAESAEAFSAIIVDKDEVTLVLREKSLETFAHRIPGHQAQRGYRLLTFDLPLELNLVGFMSEVSTCLAEAQVPIMVLSAYQRDHLLIPAAHFETARQALAQLQSRLR